MGHFAPQLNTTDADTPGVTLARFLRQLPPEITLVHDAGDRPLRWVEASDMDDPTDYLMDEEMILTSGFPLLGRVDDAKQVNAFIARLAHAKVSALGFGLEPYFTSIPVTVLNACRQYQLPLLEIPASVPFAAIGVAFAKLTEADSAAQLRANAEANRALMRCLTHTDAESQLVSTLSQRLKASVRLLGVEGQIRHQMTLAESAEISEALTSKLFAEASTSQQFTMHHEDQLVFLTFPIRAALPAGNRAPLLGVLSVGFAHSPSAFDHNLITTALDLFEVLARERAASSSASTQLAAALLFGSRVALDDSVLPLLNLSLGERTRSPVRIAVITELEHSNPKQSGFHLANLQALLDTRLVAERENHFIALTHAEPTEPMFDRLKASGYLAGFSAPVPVDHRLGEKIGDLRAQATGLLPRMREEHRSLDAQLVSHSFLSLLPMQAGKQLARQSLAPILDLPEVRRDLYLEVLRGWLDANGSWDQASKNIDLHRNSVRRHIASIGEVLNKDLNRADVRQELYLALTFLSMN
ncbi:PucR family transcriptional regulator [Glutamicibacter sp. JC586]|uniref:PucR family transcriptional regulator n=1 Tax=Glutamicibacter sp. JC586 TaxID=2590552 RepID=UPI0013569B1E|nr:PucR family transcriptional regulator [Glutamicibacter sp. JC586]